MGVFEMISTLVLRERAARCREIGKDYHPSLAVSLLEKAAVLEEEADRIDVASGREASAVTLVYCSFKSAPPHLPPSEVGITSLRPTTAVFR